MFLFSPLCPYNMNKSAWQSLSFQITVCVIPSLSVLTTQSGSGCRLIRHYQICCISAVVSINLVIKMCEEGLINVGGLPSQDVGHVFVRKVFFHIYGQWTAVPDKVGQGAGWFSFFPISMLAVCF